jgi:hypothetical protein
MIRKETNRSGRQGGADRARRKPPEEVRPEQGSSDILPGAFQNAKALRAGDVLRLQAMVGNRATEQLLMRTVAPARSPARSIASRGGADVQRVSVFSEDELAERGSALEQFAEGLPLEDATAEEANGDGPARSRFTPVFQFSDTSGTNLVVLGTVHSADLSNMDWRIIDYLQSTAFDQVYAEMGTPPNAQYAIGQEYYEKAENQSNQRMKQKLRDMALSYWTTNLFQDEFYGMLAARGGANLGLETKESRAEITKEYARLGGHNATEQRHSRKDNTAITDAAAKGDQRTIIALHSQYLKEGKDPLGIEARSRQWIGGVIPGVYHPGKTLLWIVGASHLGGIALDLKKAGWDYKPLKFA